MPFPLASSERPIGHYLGTVVDGVWYRRYRKHGLFARGLGRFWCEAGCLHFRRYLIRRPVIIPLQSVTRVALTAWHAGRWSGVRRIIVLVWTKEGQELHSGFVLTSAQREVPDAVAWIESEIAAARSAR